jgi:hypothetical protein
MLVVPFLDTNQFRSKFQVSYDLSWLAYLEVACVLDLSSACIWDARETGHIDMCVATMSTIPCEMGNIARFGWDKKH